MSKGSKPRPMNRDKFNENFDKIFGKKKEKTDENKNNNRCTYNHKSLALWKFFE